MAADYTVTCLCAEWCDTCVEYRPGFFELAKLFPQAEFRWLDIEDQAEEVGDLEVENFPTIRVTRGSEVLFYGTQLPIHQHLKKLLGKLLGEDA
jgi:thiol-disulfide isomerase/thioredoxin